MFYDWLTIYQDHHCELPVIADRYCVTVDTDTGEDLGVSQPTVKHSGSYSTQILIRVSGSRVTVSGNPSRFNRSENLFGLSSLDACVAIYNTILASYGLPPFTKNTIDAKGIANGYYQTGEKAQRIANGAVVTELHLTSNISTGADNSADFVRGISTLPYRNSQPRLHTNGNTCDWLSKSGKASSLIYPSVYIKSKELTLHALPKVARTYGTDSSEYRYLQRVISYCAVHGVVRFEQKLKSAFLRRENINLYGLIDPQKLRSIHQEFLNLPNKLQVEAMTFENVAEQLLSSNVVSSTQAANTTCMYFVQWMHGKQFDFAKSQVKTHRARLRKIGFDIALPFDQTKHGLVRVKHSRQVNISNLVCPDWYQVPRAHLQLAA